MEPGWIALVLMLVASFGVFYSGLFLLDLAPGRPDDSFRFWDGGEEALTVGGAIDLIAGIPSLFLVLALMARRALASQVAVRYKRLLTALALLFALGILGDLIAGIYGIMAQLGLYTTLAVLASYKRKTNKRAFDHLS